MRHQYLKPIKISITVNIIFAIQYKSNRTVVQITNATGAKSRYNKKKYNIAKNNETRYLLTCVLEDYFLTALSIIMWTILIITLLLGCDLFVQIWILITCSHVRYFISFWLIPIDVTNFDELSIMCRDNVMFVAFDMQSNKYCVSFDLIDVPFPQVWQKAFFDCILLL